METGVNQKRVYGFISYVNILEAENVIKSLSMIFNLDYIKREWLKFLPVKKNLAKEFIVLIIIVSSKVADFFYSTER